MNKNGGTFNSSVHEAQGTWVRFVLPISKRKYA